MSSKMDAEKIIENFDWNQLSLENLQRLQSQISKAINLKKRDFKFPKAPANNSKKYEYKATLAKVFPEGRRNSLSEEIKCVFAISLGSKNSVYSERLEACIKWISENFKACVVLVGDTVYRLTIEIRSKVKEDEALLKALNTGKEFINEHRLLFEQYSGSCQFELILASEIEKRSDFKIYYEELQGLYRKNESFQSMVNSFAQTYLNRGEQVAADEQVEDLRQKHLGTTYLLEESALFTCLVKEGWPVFVYPGSIKSLEEIAEGLHPEVPEPLKQIIWVSLRLKKRHSTSGHG